LAVDWEGIYDLKEFFDDEARHLQEKHLKINFKTNLNQ
jgi:hypothetical protein